MTFRVFYTANVQAEIAAQVDYLRDEAVAEHVIEDWFTKLFDTVDDLYEYPKRYPVDQTQTDKEGFEARKLTFGNYLVRYRIDTDRRVVEVLSFIHGAKRQDV